MLLNTFQNVKRTIGKKQSCKGLTPARLRNCHGRTTITSVDWWCVHYATHGRLICGKGTKNADTGFKGEFLNELERMLKAKLPTTNIKAKPHIESRIRTLKKDWSIVHDLFTSNNSGFGWDEERKMVTAEDYVWDSYINTYKQAAQFRRKSFPFYHEFSSIYAKAGEDIIKEMTNEEGIAQSSSGNRARSEANSNSLSSGGRRKKKISDRDEPITSQSFHNAAMMLSETLVMVGDKLSKSIGTELTLQEKVQQLDKELIQIDGLSNEEYLMALIKLPDRPNQMLVFFSLPP
nr:uncharacterized protein At2g29880-like isoform X2 [Ipomoea batatas]